MTIEESHQYFDLLTDKVGGAYWTDDEKDNFISQACIEYVKSLFPSNEGGVVNVEIDGITYSNIYTLVHQLTLAYTNSVSISTVQTALNAASSSTEKWMYILNVALRVSGTTYPVKYTRQNNWYAAERNEFKKGRTYSPIYKLDSQSFKFSPSQTIGGTPLTITLIKEPKPVSLTDETDIELPPHTHKAIVELAVKLASEGMRDPELYQMVAK